MAIDYIKVTRSAPDTPGADLLLQYVAQLRAAMDTGTRVAAIMNHNFEAPNFAPLEALFGIPAGTGQTVFDMVNGSIGALNGVFQNDQGKMITERVGG